MSDKKISQNRINKQQKVAAIAEKIAKSKSLVFSDYRGLTVSQFSELRQKVKDAGGELEVTKNTLLARALTISHKPLAISQLAGPTATLFSYQDEIAPLKALSEISQNFGLPKLKSGFLNNQFLDQEQVENLAKLPAKEVLVSQVISNLYSPIYGLASVLNANLRNLVYVLDQVSKK